MKIYDTIVIGAGIAGCSSAFALGLEGQSVLLIDRSSTPASGGSGAAGAFVSPKIGKGSPLQRLTNEAYEYAKEFYLEHFSSDFYQTGVIRMPKDNADAVKFAEYQQHNSSPYSTIESSELGEYGIEELHSSFYFPQAGVCDAPSMCREMASRVEFVQYGVGSMSHKDDIWSLYPSDTEAELLYTHNIVLATGYQNSLVDMRYMGVRGTWGSRGDYYSALRLDVSMHKSISVSANIDGVIKIGATHNKAPNPCMVCDGEPLSGLFDKASAMVDTSDFRLKETFCGMRAGSKDYFPLVGRVIDIEYMIERYPAITKGAKPPIGYHPNLYVCNGLGGRGFVFAPMMAHILARHIAHKEPIDSRVDSDRLFLKWCRKELLHTTNT